MTEGNGMGYNMNVVPQGYGDAGNGGMFGGNWMWFLLVWMAMFGTEMTDKDLERADKLAHAMKSLATYKAMKEAEEEYDEGNMSGYRGRGRNGRYVSREGATSYADGYSRGYSEAMRQSGHYPMPMPDGRTW